jgi:hypothetical protein
MDLMILSPKTHDNNHEIKSTTSFNRDDNLVWNDSKIAVLKHVNNPVKLFIDASMDPHLQQWRRSNIRLDDLQFVGNVLKTIDKPNSFAKYFNENKDKVRIRIEFDNKQRLLGYTPDGGTFKTLTTYDGKEKESLPLEYKNKFKNYSFYSNTLSAELLSFSQYGSVTLNSLVFTVNTQTLGQVDDTLSLEIHLEDTNNEPVENAPIYFSQTGASQYSIIHTDGNYSLTNAQGKATATVILHNIGKTIIKADVNQPSEMSQTIEILGVDDEIQLYITGITINANSFTDDPQEFFRTIDGRLREVEGFSWHELGINQSEIINSSDDTSTQILVFFKQASFYGNQYLTAIESSALRTAIILKLNEISGLTFNDVELRCNRVFYNTP